MHALFVNHGVGNHVLTDRAANRFLYSTNKVRRNHVMQCHFCCLFIVGNHSEALESVMINDLYFLFFCLQVFDIAFLVGLSLLSLAWNVHAAEKEFASIAFIICLLQLNKSWSGFNVICVQRALRIIGIIQFL